MVSRTIFFSFIFKFENEIIWSNFTGSDDREAWIEGFKMKSVVAYFLAELYLIPILASL